DVRRAHRGALDGYAGDPNVRVVVVTGGAPGYFIRHFSIASLLSLAESLRARDLQWRILRQDHGAVREHLKTGHRRNFGHLPWREFRAHALPVDSSSCSPAIFVSQRMVST